MIGGGFVKMNDSNQQKLFDAFLAVSAGRVPLIDVVQATETGIKIYQSETHYKAFSRLVNEVVQPLKVKYNLTAKFEVHFGTSIAEIGSAILGIAAMVLPAVPGLGKVGTNIVGGAAALGSMLKQPAMPGMDWKQVYADYLAYKQSTNQAGELSRYPGYSTTTTNNTNQNSMLDLLKKWIYVIIAVLLGAFSIIYYAKAKTTTDKRKRKVFMWLGIAAVSVGGFLGYKKIKG